MNMRYGKSSVQLPGHAGKILLYCTSKNQIKLTPTGLVFSSWEWTFWEENYTEEVDSLISGPISTKLSTWTSLILKSILKTSEEEGHQRKRERERRSEAPASRVTRNISAWNWSRRSNLSWKQKKKKRKKNCCLQESLNPYLQFPHWR